MKLSDYVAQKISELGIEQVFMITGGGAMHLNQSLGNHPSLNCIFNHHEQACAIAAESYYRLTNRPAIVNVTTGPGGTNTLTGVHGAWTDSLGMLVISGQVKYETTVQSTGLNLRQYGDQEIEIIKMVSSITKYSVMITDPNSIRYHLEKAFYLAISGRPGPCWIDIPIDIQAAQINPDELEKFDPSELPQTWKKTDLNHAVQTILDQIAKAKRPVVFAGAGIRLSGQHDQFLQFLDKVKIPVVTGWNAHDAVWNDHPNYVGRPGTVGDRAGNFVVQNADLLIILGSRLNIRQVSYNWASFASKADKIWIDIDDVEMQKPSIKAETCIHADLADLLVKLNEHTYNAPEKSHDDWMAWCKERQKNYPVTLDEYWANPKINLYCFIDTLFKQLPNDQIVVTANGSACVVGFQAAYLKQGQRLWTNSGSAAMGYDLPAAIGAYKGSKGAPIACLAGDGSIMMNLQELQTIAGNNMPIKIFIINNQGYSSINQTHHNFFNGNEVGASPMSGVTFPDFEKIALAFNMPYVRCSQHSEMIPAIERTMTEKGPAICEIMVDEKMPFAPKLSSKQLPDGTIISPSLEDMAPFLSEEELKKNMLN